MEHSFFDTFTAFSAAEQQAQMEKALDVSSSSVAYSWMSPENIAVAPIYFSKPDESKKILTAPPTAWKIVQAISVKGELDFVIEQVKESISAEVDCLHFLMEDDVEDVRLLLNVIAKSNLTALFVFKGIPEDSVMVQFNALDNISVVVDFYGQYARKARWKDSEIKDQERWLSFMGHAVETPLFVNASIYANVGANLVQQIAYALAQLNSYLSLIDDSALAFPSSIHVQFGQGGNYFFEIAKLTSFRFLAELIIRSYDKTLTLEITAEPQKRNKTTTDYNVNLLRTTTEVMSGVLGGANRILNHPYDLRFNPPNAFGHRIARNQLQLLKHESYFDKLPNVVEGSYYLETIVKEMKDKGWAQFLSLEEKGGWLVALESNEIQSQIEQVREAEKMRFKAGQQILVGTNRYVAESGLSASVKSKKKMPVASCSPFTPLQTVYLSNDDES